MGGMGIVINSATIDTSAAEAAIHRVGAVSDLMEQTIIEAMRLSLRSMGLTYDQIDRTFARVFAFQREWKRIRDEAEAEAEKTDTKIKHKSSQWRHHMLAMVHQVWSIIEQATGLGKTQAGRIIGLAVSAIASVISMGYAAAATMATMGPAGGIMAALQIASTMASVTAQANAVATQQAIENNKDNIGEDMFK
jgi:hypothetical protein